MKKSELRTIIKEELSKQFKVGSSIKFNKKIDKLFYNVVINDKLEYKIYKIDNHNIQLLSSAHTAASIPIELFNIWLKNNTLSILKY